MTNKDEYSPLPQASNRLAWFTGSTVVDCSEDRAFNRRIYYNLRKKTNMYIPMLLLLSSGSAPHCVTHGLGGGKSE